MISELFPYAPYVLTGVPAAATAVAAGSVAHGLGFGMSYWRAESPDLRANLRRAAAIRRTWNRTARRLGLFLEDRSPTLADRWNGRSKAQQARILIPRLVRAEADVYGVTVILRTVEGVDLAAVRKQSEHLRHAWRARRLSMEEPEPGFLRLRALVTDPLTLDVQASAPLPLTTAEELTAALQELPLGLDRDANLQSLPIANGAACTVGGNPGYGKSAFARGVVVHWAAHPWVQLIGANGKAPGPLIGDYRPLAPRFASLLGDDLELVRVQMRQLQAEMRRRYSLIWEERGTDDFWSAGPSQSWPLIVAIYDECQHYLHDPEIAEMAEDLTKKCRGAGIYIFWLTQKATADAIPTAIRDVSTSAILFPVRTTAAAVAGLDAGIHEFPEDNPSKLMDPLYRGVGTVRPMAKAGYTQFKSPFCPPELAAQVCQATAKYVRDIPGVTVGVSHRPGKVDVVPEEPTKLDDKRRQGGRSGRDQSRGQAAPGPRRPAVRPADFLPGESLGRRGAKRRADGEAAG